MAFEAMFQPIKIGPVEISNRLAAGLLLYLPGFRCVATATPTWGGRSICPNTGGHRAPGG